MARQASLNPLFIRSSIPLGFMRIKKRYKLIGLNPLFIRSSIPFATKNAREGGGRRLVSIPYSSGHLFRYGSQALAAAMKLQESQSLIHQVIYSVGL